MAKKTSNAAKTSRPRKKSATKGVSSPAVKKSTAKKKPAPRKKPDPEAVKALAAVVVERLARDYAIAECALVHRNPFELLIATILSAQCTDERVNLVTKDLFAKYPKPADLAAASLEQIETVIQSTGFFRNKAKNIQACAKALVDRHGGEVPAELEKLVKLAGVGRKTANVVLGTWFGIASGVVVDTHVARLTKRLGLTNQTDPEKIEAEMMAALPSSEWIAFSHRLIHHGRQVCDARKPECDRCGMNDVCPKIDVAT